MSDRCTIDAALILAMASALLPVPPQHAKPDRSDGIARKFWHTTDDREQPASRDLGYLSETAQPRSPAPHRRAA
jgi:hypothetical protein